VVYIYIKSLLSCNISLMGYSRSLLRCADACFVFLLFAGEYHVGLSRSTAGLFFLFFLLFFSFLSWVFHGRCVGDYP